MKMIILFALLGVSATALASEGRLCATAFGRPGDHYGYRHHGERLEIMDGDQANDLRKVTDDDGRDWDNRISRVIVEPGCKFVGFEYRQFNVSERHSDQGMPNAAEVVLNNRHGDMCWRDGDLYGSDYKTISSFKCSCPGDNWSSHRHHEHADFYH